MRKGNRKAERALENFLQRGHRRGCSWRITSDGDRRHCSCGLFLVREEVERLREVEAAYWKVVAPPENPAARQALRNAQE